MKLKVWILFHRWDGDESSNLHATKEDAENAIQSYVMDQWEEGVMDDEEMPNDPNDAVQKYFEYHEDMEWHNIYSQTVNFPDLEIPAINQLFIHTQPAHLQKLSGSELSTTDRNIERARYLRRHLNKENGADGAEKN